MNISKLIADGRIRGVFFNKETHKIGTGVTTRRVDQKNFWFVEQREDKMVDCQMLNAHYVPTGGKKTISVDELLQFYSPEPDFYVNVVRPKMKELQCFINCGDDHRSKGETFAAEYQYLNALKLDEENIKANFGIGLTYLGRGEADKAEDIFNRLIKLEGTFEEQHKHLFNAFGITLRKSKMYPQAVAYYQRALELAHVDENLHMNLARALFEVQNYDSCVAHLLEALELAPNHKTSLRFMRWMNKKKLIPNACKQDVEIALSRGSQQPVHVVDSGELNLLW